MDLGRVEHHQAWRLQKRLVDLRQKGLAPDLLLLLEHPPVYTLGRRGQEVHLLDREAIGAKGIPIAQVDRGGDVTYHGPGQLVAYPILDIRSMNMGPRLYVCSLEEALILALGDFGLKAHRMEGYPGVWVGEEKVAAIGVRISRGVSCHGFALNVALDMSPFTYILPCGIAGKGVTSMERLLGLAPGQGQVKARVMERFGQVFHLQMEEVTQEGLESWVKEGSASLATTG